MGTMTLADFLLARIAEDEAWARESLPPGAVDYDVPGRYERVLAECDAKRRIVEHEAPGPRNQQHGAIKWEFVPPVLRILALPYADHPDFDPAWKV